MKHRFLLVVTLLLLHTACSTAKVRVMPGPGGQHRVVTRDIERDGAEEASVDAAKEYCEKLKKQAIFTTADKTTYTGSMDENTRKTVRNASTAAMILGGAGAGPRSTRTAGAILGSAGTVGRIMTSDRDYENVLEFRCE